MKEYTANDLFIFNDHEKVIIISSTSCSICTASKNCKSHLSVHLHALVILCVFSHNRSLTSFCAYNFSVICNKQDKICMIKLSL